MAIKYLSPKDLWNEDIERGNMSWWFPKNTDSSLPEYQCANCGGSMLYDKPSKFCRDCGSLMANYYRVKEEYERKMQAFQEDKK